VRAPAPPDRPAADSTPNAAKERSHPPVMSVRGSSTARARRLIAAVAPPELIVVDFVPSMRAALEAPQPKPAAVQPPAPTRPPAAPPALKPTAQEARRPRRVRPNIKVAALLAAGLIVVVVLAVSAVSVMFRRSPPPTPARPVAAGASNLELAAAERWMTDNLPAGARILADATTASALRRSLPKSVQVLVPAFVPTARTLGPSGMSGYLLRTPALQSAAFAGSAAVNAELLAAVPLAVFGNGSAQLVVEQVLGMSEAERSARLEADRNSRRIAGPALVRNPGLAVGGSARAPLQNGMLDLRPATALALLAVSTAVSLVSLPIDPAEAEAGRPIRSIRVTVSEPATLTRLVSMLPVEYRPRSVHAGSDGVFTLTWAPAVAPIPPAE
jgi:hypothetical protein